MAGAELERSAKNDAQPRVQPDPPIRAFYLANAGGGGPANLVLLGHIAPSESLPSVSWPAKSWSRRSSFSCAHGGVLASVSSAGRWIARPVPHSAWCRALRSRAGQASVRTPPRFGVMATAVAAASGLAPALCFEQHRGEVKHCNLSYVTVSSSKSAVA